MGEIMSSQNKCAVIFGTFINGYGIYRSLRDSGFRGNIYVAEATRPIYKKTFIELCTKDIKVIHKVADSTQDVVEILNQIPEKNKCVFFTAEECMDFVKEAIEKNLVENVRAYTGAGIGNKYILDKYEFYKLINEHKLGSAPKTISSEEDPEKVFGKKYVIRSKQSWIGSLNTPRITIVKDLEERRKIETLYEKMGMKKADWCYQELLSVIPQANLSVVGWYEKGTELFFAHKKIVRFPEKNGTGCIAEFVEKCPADPLNQTRRILKYLDYKGPFELEFLYDPEEKIYKAIDFNPRFWMQHELIEKTSEYFMIRKILGEEISPKSNYNIYYKYWINTNQTIYKVLTGHFSLIKYFRSAVRAPGVVKSIKWIIYVLYSKSLGRKNRLGGNK
ncbi:hypothetical protein LI297_06845 [Anaerostipes caccae]|uniref:hypothetical protein n=2 Tax=Anaerostipes caccae TaxID=105841 RepID=UPI001EE14CDF|nr:hypothetical protein [Anaerostipes caccae]MCB6295549.1 hypothetical protein [Anaerostipes caccae]MCB6372947.1 hypothetical protein [Anaerostipes caccae]MCB7300076.1 hypothetical protein [Anaerostipes caccae]